MPNFDCRVPIGRSVFAITLAIFVWIGLATASLAQPIDEALALAYNNNPELNAQRAATRAVDENVAIAKSGYRPSIFGDADYGKDKRKNRNTGLVTSLDPGGFGVSISQTLWDSFRTRNDVESAKAAVFASREVLRNTEQNVLFDAASAYMNVIRDREVVVFRKQSLEFLEELVRSERARFEVGESTRTDVALAESQRAAAQADLNVANALLKTSIGIYRQIIGVDPGKLIAPRGVANLAPRDIPTALNIAYDEHPAILATRYLVDEADWNVKRAESDLLPTVTLEGSLTRGYNRGSDLADNDNATVTARLRVPIYQGGRVSATVRRNKETLGQRRIEVDLTVDEVRSAIISAYSELESARATVQAGIAQERASNLALQGTVEERKVGQRTTLDVLRSQQDVIDAQLTLTDARRNQIVAGYAVLSAIGRLDANTLRLAVVDYDPIEHYEIVKDKWFGLRTPDGR